MALLPETSCICLPPLLRYKIKISILGFNSEVGKKKKKTNQKITLPVYGTVLE